MNAGIEGHTELPWSWSGEPRDLVIWSAEPDHRVCFMTSNGPNAANAAFIVQAVNSHDDLVAALRGLLGFIQKQDCAVDTDFAEAALAKASAS